MNHYDMPTEQKYPIKNIRAIELRFDNIVKTTDDIFTLILNDIEIATIRRDCLTDQTASKLDSLSQHRI